ncbi:MAG: DUF924 domain-containing protein [Massilia sp.]|nr:DUF924 domain-containing protein [Massilia sp.]
MSQITAQDVLDFWFLPASNDGHGKARQAWFRKDAQFDAAIGARFGAAMAEALAGGLRDWDGEGAHGTLARIVLLDQFTRNAFRDTSAAFAGEGLALAAALDLEARGAARTLPALQRWFAYLPFEHAEDLHMQEKSVALFAELAAGDAQFADALDYAHRHRDVIARFGRFPHRNAILGRASSAEELAFLRQPGSRF